MYTCVWEHGTKEDVRCPPTLLSACRTLASVEASKPSNSPVSAQLSTRTVGIFSTVWFVTWVLVSELQSLCLQADLRPITVYLKAEVVELHLSKQYF